MCDLQLRVGSGQVPRKDQCHSDPTGCSSPPLVHLYGSYSECSVAPMDDNTQNSDSCAYILENCFTSRTIQTIEHIINENADEFNENEEELEMFCSIKRKLEPSADQLSTSESETKRHRCDIFKSPQFDARSKRPNFIPPITNWSNWGCFEYTKSKNYLTPHHQK